jgi:hypothetical protein
MTSEQNPQTHNRWSPATIIAFLGFAAVAAFYLWTEHRAHLLGALPFLIFLICPLMHFFMHRGHGHGGHDGVEKPAGHDHRSTPGGE